VVTDAGRDDAVTLYEDEARMLPRIQSGYPPQHLLLTLLGDYGISVGEPIPSGALVTLLDDFGVSVASARAALSRLARRDLLLATRDGRNTAYALTERCARVVAEGRRLTYGYTGRIEGWDGRWTVVAYSIAEERRSQRAVLRARLRWLGFAPLQDGLWVSPRPPEAALDTALAESGAASCTVFVGEHLAAAGRQQPMDAWDLDEIRDAFARFATEFEPLVARAERGEVGPAEALVARSRLTYRWFALANHGANLPAALLPPDWPGHRARVVFVTLVDALGPLAAERFAVHVGALAPALATHVRSLTIAEAMASATS
jgi:phenylacetic acid degradation operon negative regulatory protein